MLLCHILLVLLAVGPMHITTASQYLYFDRVLLDVGNNIGSHIKERLFAYLRSVPNIEVDHFNVLTNRNTEKSSLVLSIGNTTTTRKYIPIDTMNSLPAESFQMTLQPHHTFSNTYILSSDGLPLNAETHKNVSFDKSRVHYGAVVGAYAALEELGFSFLHPLEPYIPSQIRIQVTTCMLQKANESLDENENPREVFSFNRIESPYWPERAFHIHTQHPLELTEVLQGHDIPQFGPHGPSCKHHTKPKPLVNHRPGHAHMPSVDKHAHKQSNTSITLLHNLNPTPETHAPRSVLDKKAPYCERWEDMVTDVDYLFEWAVANRLNKIEWLLLGNYKWGDEWATRRNRLKTLTNLGHQYSLLIGADVPLGNVQQHGWYIVNVRLPFAQQAEQIKQRVDWVLKAGFDFLTTESGLSEFTHPECDHMLELMNVFADHVNVTWGREAAIKVHCSTGQTCEDYPDPRTGEPINFNFLPTYAHPGMGVFPHTVQVYALDDPTAFAYGNENFSYVEEFMVYEAKRHNRSVHFYGETAYWVNVDIDVPLFLPIYGQRRQHDLRRLAVREIRENFRIDGQVNFDSGWEWGYWLSDVVTARASWDPNLPLGGSAGSGGGAGGADGSCSCDGGAEVVVEPEGEGIADRTDAQCGNCDGQEQCSSQSETYSAGSTRNMLPSEEYEAKHDQWTAFATAVQPFTKIYGPEYSTQLNTLLVELAQAQAELLIHGRVGGVASPDLRKLGGMAYLSGGDTWVDVPRFFGIPFTQPDKVHLRESQDPDWPHVLLLLAEMRSVFGGLARRMEILHERIILHVAHQGAEHASNAHSPHVISTPEIVFQINPAAMKFLAEIHDCVTMLALRSSQVLALYQSRDPVIGADIQKRADLQRQSRGIVHEAEKVVARREANYRVPWQRVGEWRENPTVYRFGYLWAVHSLYYWWRDQGLAEQGSFQSEHSPCYLNRMDTTEVAVGWGKYTLELLRAFINRYTPFSAGSPLEMVNCLSPPAKGYEFPKDLYHF